MHNEHCNALYIEINRNTILNIYIYFLENGKKIQFADE